MEVLGELSARIESSLAEMDREMGDAERAAYSARSSADEAAAQLAAAAEANRQMAKARDAAENPPAPVELGAEEVCEHEPSLCCSSPATVAGAPL